MIKQNNLPKGKGELKQQMTGILKTTTCTVNHRTFGGIIYHSDFNTDDRSKYNKNGSTIAQRIISDKRFDNECMENRRRKQNGENKI